MVENKVKNMKYKLLSIGFLLAFCIGCGEDSIKIDARKIAVVQFDLQRFYENNPPGDVSSKLNYADLYSKSQHLCREMKSKYSKTEDWLKLQTALTKEFKKMQIIPEKQKQIESNLLCCSPYDD